MQGYESTGATNVNTIKREYINVGKKAISEFGIDMYIASYDYDDTNLESYNHHIEQQISRLDNKIRRKSILCVPIKCIEYWLYYIKKPDSSKLEEDNEFNRHDAKSEVYERELEDGKYNKLFLKKQMIV